MVIIQWDKQKLGKLAATFRQFPAAMRRVVPRAVNETAEQCREEVIDEITAIRNIRRRSVKSKIPIRKARANNWQATLGISRRRISLMGFGAKWFYAPGTARMSRGIGGKGTNYRIETMSIARQRVVTYNISGQRYLQHAFIAVGASGNRLVFERKGKARHPLRSLSGPSLGQVVTDAPAILDRVVGSSGKRLEYNIGDHVRRFLRQYSAGLVTAKGTAIESQFFSGSNAG